MARHRHDLVLEAAFQDGIKQAREAALGCDTTSESNSTPERATDEAKGLGGDDRANTVKGDEA